MRLLLAVTYSSHFNKATFDADNLITNLTIACWMLQAQVGDIGLMGGPAKLDGKAVEGVRLFKGGTIGEKATLATEFEKGVACDESILLPKLRDLLIEEHGAKLKAGYVVVVITFFCIILVVVFSLTCVDFVRIFLIPPKHWARAQPGAYKGRQWPSASSLWSCLVHHMCESCEDLVLIPPKHWARAQPGAYKEAGISLQTFLATPTLYQHKLSLSTAWSA